MSATARMKLVSPRIEWLDAAHVAGCFDDPHLHHDLIAVLGRAVGGALQRIKYVLGGVLRSAERLLAASRYERLCDGELGIVSARDREVENQSFNVLRWCCA